MNIRLLNGVAVGLLSGVFATSDCAIPTRNLRYQCIDGFVAAGFDQEKLEDIQAGMDRFNSFVDVPGLARLVDSRIGDRTCYLSVFSSPQYDGYWYSSSRTIVLNVDLTDRDRTVRVMMHELGHSIGFVHLESGVDGIMAKDVTAQDWTDADRLECERVSVCGTEKE